MHDAGARKPGLRTGLGVKILTVIDHKGGTNLETRMRWMTVLAVSGALLAGGVVAEAAVAAPGGGPRC